MNFNNRGINYGLVETLLLTEAIRQYIHLFNDNSKTPRCKNQQRCFCRFYSVPLREVTISSLLIFFENIRFTKIDNAKVITNEISMLLE
jgi:hypothetical protein